MTKIDIFSGFLGAGKTTLIKKLIKEAYAGEKLVLVENEFGEIGVDGTFMQDAGITVNELNSGCICCSLVGDFSKALKEVIHTYSPERILIEPSGVGKLSDIITAVQNAGVEGAELNTFTTVVDATKAKMYMKNFGEFFGDQVENASCIIFSHTDVASQKKLEEALALVKEHNPTATMILTPWSQLTGKEILSAMEHKDSLEMELARLKEEHRKQLEEEEHHHHHRHDEDGEEECCCHHHHDEDEDEEKHEHHHHHHHDEDDEEECCCHHHHDEDEDEEKHEHHHHHHHDEDDEEECCCHHHHDEDEDEEKHEHHHHHHHDEDDEEECCCHHHHDGDEGEEEHEHHHHEGEECHCGHHHHHHHHADEVFTSWGVETVKPFEIEQLTAILTALSEEEKYGTVLRAKGVVPQTGGGFIHFDYTPGEPDVRQGSAAAVGMLCVIGSGIKEEELKKLFGV